MRKTKRRRPPAHRVDAQSSTSVAAEDLKKTSASPLTGTPEPASSKPTQINLKRLQLKEAEWIWHETVDSIRLIQRYRGLYVTAVFLSVGWVIGQVLIASINAGNPTPNVPVHQFSLEPLRSREDLAILLIVIAAVNMLFMFLMLESYAYVRSLLRYRFILGYELGGNMPAWRFERWKDTREGSIRRWTATLNTLFFLICVFVTTTALAFPFPAMKNGNMFIKAAWGAVVLLFLILAGVTILLGLRYRKQAGAASVPTIRWEDLGDVDLDLGDPAS